MARALPRAWVGVSPAAAERALTDLERAYDALRETRQAELASRAREAEEESATLRSLEQEVEAEAVRIRQEMQRMDGFLHAVRDRVAQARRPMDLEEARAAGRVTDLEVRLGDLYAAGDEFRQGLRDVLLRARLRFERDGEESPDATARDVLADPASGSLGPVPVSVGRAPLEGTAR